MLLIVRATQEDCLWSVMDPGDPWGRGAPPNLPQPPPIPELLFLPGMLFTVLQHSGSAEDFVSTPRAMDPRETQGPVDPGVSGVRPLPTPSSYFWPNPTAPAPQTFVSFWLEHTRVCNGKNGGQGLNQ